MWKIMRRKKISAAGMALVLVFFVFLGLCGCSKGNRETITLEEAAGIQESARSTALAGDRESTAGSDNPDAEDLEYVVYVHVCGAVVSPGVVEVPRGSRAQAAVDAAGGFGEDADTAYVNLAASVSDGEQLYIPTLEEAQAQKSSLETAQSSVVNLNTADIKQLCTLPGIGESRAGDIIAYRQEHGGFSEIEEIMNVTGIKESTYNKIKDLITVK